ncbi:MAG: hypothetical protein R3E39_06575 [Anaerolineae bacterium]
MNKKSPSSLRTERLSFKQRLESLLLNITEHLEAEKYFNFSIPPHREITEALHHLIHMSGEPANLLIRYNDGSHGRPFPIRSLWLPDDGWNWQPNPRQHLHVGTLSFRHVIYDKYVDMYLVRDKETRRLLQGEIDSLAHQRMKQLLNAREFQGESYITVYQTGLEPLVIWHLPAPLRSICKREI